MDSYDGGLAVVATIVVVVVVYVVTIIIATMGLILYPIDCMTCLFLSYLAE